MNDQTGYWIVMKYGGLFSHLDKEWEVERQRRILPLPPWNYPMTEDPLYVRLKCLSSAYEWAYESIEEWNTQGIDIHS